MIALQIVASDAEGNPLDYSATGLPTGLSIDLDSGESAAPSPPQRVLFDATVTVDDGLAATQVDFSWTVSTPGNNAPDVTDPGDQGAP